jgi:dolichol-phosphate mannosyltransferase
MDADLQDPPEIVPMMLDMARSQGLDVVYGVRSDRSVDSVFKRWTASWYYRLARRLAGPQVPAAAGDFRLVSHRVVETLLSLPQQGQVHRLAIPWFGFPSAQVEYVRGARTAGETKYTVSKMTRLALDGVTSFSSAPLRLATWLGLGGVVVCFALVAYVTLSVTTGTVVPGWASTLLIVATLGAVQLLSLGILGEYVGRIFDANQHRPAYLVDYDSGADPGSSDAAG